jgi:hypothetical protein
MLSASVEVCLGFASWSINNTGTATSYLQDPTDITCVAEDFNIVNWMDNSSSKFPLGVLQGLGWNTVNNLPLQMIALNVILATLNHTTSEIELNQTYASMISENTSSPVPPQCSKTTPAPDIVSPWVAIGIIPSSGTGMTQLGVVLQVLVTVLCILTLMLLFIPILPLVTEWQAQWLGLVYGLSSSKVQEVVEGQARAGTQQKIAIGTKEKKEEKVGYGLGVVAEMWLKGVRI